MAVIIDNAASKSMLLLKDHFQIIDYIFRSILPTPLVTRNELNRLLKMIKDTVSDR